jgi:membrane protein YqaA with SNARE-associated domain
MSSFEVYFILFISSFVSSTILPGNSELTLTAFISQREYETMYLIIIASIGNVSGSIVNWYLGLNFIKFKNKKWFPFKEKNIKNSSKWFLKYGKWSLLISWVPFIGDGLTLIAGISKLPLNEFIIFVTIAKVARYIFVAMIASSIFQ